MATNSTNHFIRKADVPAGGPAKKSRPDYVGIVMFVVEGKHQRPIVVHEHLLYRHAKIGEMRPRPAYIPGMGEQTTITNRSARTFEAYVGLLYSQDEDVAQITWAAMKYEEAEVQDPGAAEDREGMKCLGLVKLWFLSSLLGDATCKDRIINSLIKEFAADYLRLLNNPHHPHL